MSVPNLVAWFAQIAVLVAVCAGLPRLLRLRSPGIQYVFWRVLLVVCLLMPIVEPRVPAQMVSVPAPAGAALLAPGTDAALALAAPAAPASIDWWTVAAVTIAAGAALRLAWVALGILRLRRMRRGAREQAAGFDDLARTIGVSAPILWSCDVAHPVTFGVVRPVVLLPVAIKSVDTAAQRAVVAHELHHVKRRDWLWVVTEEVVRSILWFHPAVWWLISRVQLARETVVDELSILTTNARRAYLDTLLAFADDTGLQSSPAFSARRHLFHRVMLLSREGGMSSIRIAIASCLLVLALGAGSWGAAQAFPLYAAAQPPPPPPPPRPSDPLSPEAYSRLGVLYFEQLRRPALTDSQKIEIIGKGIAAEDRALEVKPNYADAMIWKAVLLRAQANLAANSVDRDRLINEADALRAQAKVLYDSGRAYVSRDAISGPPPPPPPPPPSRGVNGGVPRGVASGVAAGVPGGVAGSASEMVFVPASPASGEFGRIENAVRVGGPISQPIRIRDVRPVYPPIAQQSNVTGVVILEIVIDTEGNVGQAQVLRSIPLLDQAALDAVKQWKYTPTEISGTAVPVIMTVVVNFTLQP